MMRLAESDNIQARALQLIMLTGARKNEILKAKWEWVSFEHHMLNIPLSKSGKTRHIMLSGAAIKILEKFDKSSIWLFPGRNPEKPLKDIFSFWKQIREELGLGNVRIHDLRHTFASYLVNNGHSLYEVQKILGHADPRTTMRYAHLENEALLLATESVGNLLLGKKQKYVSIDALTTFPCTIIIPS